MSKIQWTDVTDNPIVVTGGGWYCQKYSPGCANCYAERINQSSFFKGNHRPYAGDTPELMLRRETIERWHRQRTPKKHFVCSMTDLFGHWVPDEWCFEILGAMAIAPCQTFQVLTKRAMRLRSIVTCWQSARARHLKPPANIWLGASVEDQCRLDDRAPHLDIVRRMGFTTFYSVEPLLEEVDLRLDLFPVDWVVVGGESGQGARPCRLEWIRSVVRQCQATNTPVFVKQLGSKPIGLEGGELLGRAGDKHGDLERFPVDLRVREFPQ